MRNELEIMRCIYYGSGVLFIWNIEKYQYGRKYYTQRAPIDRYLKDSYFRLTNPSKINLACNRRVAHIAT
jgi:hypothetical protein